MIDLGKDVLELHDIVAVWCAINNPPEVSQAADSMPTLTPGWVAKKRVFDIER